MREAAADGGGDTLIREQRDTHTAPLRHIGETFEDQRVELDRHVYERCTFINCEFVYRGETPARIDNCRVEDAELTLEGPAGQTIDFLTVMYQAGFKPHVVGALRNIRKGHHPS